MLGLVLLGTPGEAPGSHGGPLQGVVIDFVGLRAPDEGGSCRVAGVVRNGSTLTVTVRVRYRAQARGGPTSHATARITRVPPGEDRPFASTPFQDNEGRTAGAACAELARVEMVEAVAEPAP